MLLPGVAASAFHALIRLAYAIEVKNDNEIAISLAYWCAEYQSFELTEQVTQDGLEVVLARLAPVGVKHKFSPGIIVDRMAEVGELLQQGRYAYLPSKVDFFELRKLCLKAFVLNNDFTLLHTVTGCHAFSIILPYVDNLDVALQKFWQAILIAYLSTGLNFDNIEIEILVLKCNFDALIEQALLSSDSHVIKLVYSCFQEYSKDQYTLYYQVAERAVSNSFD